MKITREMIQVILDVNLSRVNDPDFNKPEYIERAREIDEKIKQARRDNFRYYKELQAQEDKKWADIKAKRNNKRGRK